MVAGAAVAQQIDRGGGDVVILIRRRFLFERVDEHLKIGVGDAADQLVGLIVVEIDHWAPGLPREGMRFAEKPFMGLSQTFAGIASRRATRRLTRTLPWLGGAIILFTVGKAIRKKG